MALDRGRIEADGAGKLSNLTASARPLSTVALATQGKVVSMRELDEFKTEQTLLSVSELTVMAQDASGATPLLSDLSIKIERGHLTGIVGASGSGKSTLLRALLGVLPVSPGIICGSIWHEGDDGRRQNLLEGLEQAVTQPPGGRYKVSSEWRDAYQSRMKSLWGCDFGYAPQHGNLALDPTLKVGQLIAEALAARATSVSRSELESEGLGLMASLGFSEVEKLWRLYPRELSGGMAQRVAIATALARGCRLLFADEPTAGLDSDAAETVIAFLQTLRAEGRLKSLVLVSHDIGLIMRLADRTYVLDKGRVVDRIEREEFSGALEGHPPFTRRLREEHARLTRAQREYSKNLIKSSGYNAILTVDKVYKGYRRKRVFWRGPAHRVLEGIDLELRPGEIVGLMGPSGSGKTTLGRCIGGGLRADSGRIRVGEYCPYRLRRKGCSWKLVQLLHQPVEAFIHPMMSIEEALLETARSVLRLPPAKARREIDSALKTVGLEHRRFAYPAVLSGGELRRVGVARVLMTRPRLLVADEPTAGVDPFLRASLLDLLIGMCKGPSQMAMLLISHDVDAVFYAADRVLELRDGVLEPRIGRSVE